jgi:arsenite methyltransferase
MSLPATETIVKARYAAGAQAVEAALCCPVDYDPQYLKLIPQEVIEKDYGCGDPSRYVLPGETVLDLGSGTGKICFIASQVVGATGRVIGVDMTDDMLEVARRNAPIVAERVGYANVEFRKGRIQDLGLNLESMERELREHPIKNANSYLLAMELAAELRIKEPLIPDASIDVVVSNCVLNLVGSQDRQALFAELYRVLKDGGRAVISDIVCDEDVPLELQQDAELWSGCISGAFREDEFLQAFSQAGFHGIQIVKFDHTPWQTVQGIEFRSVTVTAYKGKVGPCLDRNQAVIYNGPFKKVLDDDGHAMERGQRYAVCEKTYRLYQQAPYAGSFTMIAPLTDEAPDTTIPFACDGRLRHPKETKGHDYHATVTRPAGEKCC